MNATIFFDWSMALLLYLRQLAGARMFTGDFYVSMVEISPASRPGSCDFKYRRISLPEHVYDSDGTNSTFDVAPIGPSSRRTCSTRLATRAGRRALPNA